MKNSNFKFLKFKRIFARQDDFKLKSCQLQIFITFRDLQTLFWLFGHLFILHDGSKYYSQILYLSRGFMKLYERDIDFVNNIIITLSNEEMTKIKVVDLEKL